MRNFWSNPAKQEGKQIPDKLMHMLVLERGLNREANASLRLVEKTGRFSGRKVTFFRVFEPVAAKAAGLNEVHFDDLDAPTTLYYGHTEKDGEIILSRGEWKPAVGS